MKEHLLNHRLTFPKKPRLALTRLSAKDVRLSTILEYNHEEDEQFLACKLRTTKSAFELALSDKNQLP